MTAVAPTTLRTVTPMVKTRQITEEELEQITAETNALEEELKALEKLDQEQRGKANEVIRGLSNLLREIPIEVTRTEAGEVHTQTVEEFKGFWVQMIKRPNQAEKGTIELKRGDTLLFKVFFDGIRVDVTSPGLKYGHIDPDDAWRKEFATALYDQSAILRAKQEAEQAKERRRIAEVRKQELRNEAYVAEIERQKKLVSKLAELRQRRQDIGLEPAGAQAQAQV